MSAKSPIVRKLVFGMKIVLPLLALFVGGASYLSLKANRPNPPKPVKREAVQPVRTQNVVLASHQPRLRLYGEIKAGRKVDLRALVAGKVLQVGGHFREGALVEKGDMLLSIDAFAYEGAVVEAEARLVEARARLKEIKAQIKAEEGSITYASEQLKLAKRDLDRAQKLVKRGSVTRQGVDQRRLVVSQRRQTEEGKRANLAILRARAEQQVAGIASLKWRLQQAQRNRRDTRLKAPFDGYISEVNASVGKLLNGNDRVAVLLDRHWMDVVFTLSDRQYGRLLEPSNSAAVGQGMKPSNSAAVGQGMKPSNSAAPGQTKESKDGLIGRVVRVTWKLGETLLPYEAVIERVGAQISSETGGVTVYAKLKNPSVPRSIRTGAFVDVDVPDRLYHKVVRLPQTAIYTRSKVYVVGPKSRLVERLVKLHGVDGEFVLVSGDLIDGERVVTTRLSTIGGGMKVRDLEQAVKPGPDKHQRKNRRKPTLGGVSRGKTGAKRQKKRQRDGVGRRSENKNSG